jgi:hypothetical protein
LQQAAGQCQPGGAGTHHQHTRLFHRRSLRIKIQYRSVF